jgi:hypothetical protein
LITCGATAWFLLLLYFHQGKKSKNLRCKDNFDV